MRLVPYVVALGMMSVALVRGTQTSSGQTDDHTTLPAGAGRDLVIRVCSQCHSPDVVAGQEFDAAAWKSLVDQMAARGAMATDEELESIVRYLVTAFPVNDAPTPGVSPEVRPSGHLCGRARYR
jgi:mono/diheme cytochrome c family protein